MKLTYKKIDRKPENSLLASRRTIPHLEEYWHYHTELELIYFLKSTGTFYIGNTVDHFREGEIYFMGSNLPHLKKSDKSYYDPNRSDLIVDLIIVQFREDFLGKEFMVLPETKNLQSLFYKAARGLKYSKSTSCLLHDRLIELPQTRGLASLVDLLKILDTLSKSEDCEFICPEGINVTFRGNDQMRMSKVINYLTENYDRKITIEEMAGVASMAPNAFCRFFRNKTHKSFTEYLNEIRIGNACKLLIEGKKQVSQISCLSGFGSLSNFNRKFRQIMDSTPSEYMQKYCRSIESV